MNDKPFMTISRQITLLRSRNLKFIDEVVATQRIANDGYYEIINGYKDTFMDGIDHFKEGTTFEDIYALYFLDTRIRSAVMDSLSFFEQALKQKLSYLLAEKYSETYDNYVSPKVFKSGNKLERQNKKIGLLNDRDLLFMKFNRVKNSDYEPFNNYRENHGNVPPWILFKGIDFGALRTAVKLLRKDDKILLAKRVFKPSIVEIHNDEQIVELLSVSLFMANKFRNRAAHGGRIYNYTPEGIVKYNQKLYIDSMISLDSLREQKASKTNLFVLYNLISYTNTGLSFTLLKSGLNNSLLSYSHNWNDQIPSILESMSFPSDYNWK